MTLACLTILWFRPISFEILGIEPALPQDKRCRRILKTFKIIKGPVSYRLYTEENNLHSSFPFLVILNRFFFFQTQVISLPWRRPYSQITGNASVVRDPHQANINGVTGFFAVKIPSVCLGTVSRPYIMNCPQTDPETDIWDLPCLPYI